MHYRLNRRASHPHFGARANKNSKIAKIFNYVAEKKRATKYDVVTNILGVKRNRRDARGYYSTNFQTYRDEGFMNYNEDKYEYSLTTKGLYLLTIMNAR